LIEHLNREPPYARFLCSVAWARASGVAQLAAELARFPGRTEAIIGLDFGQTSYEGLLALFHLLDEVYIFRTAPGQVYHPKLYMFVPDEADPPAPGAALIGSSNLTRGGLDANFELMWQHQIAAADPQWMRLLAYVERLKQEPGCQRIDSVDMLDMLLERDEVTVEREERAAARQRDPSQGTGRVAQTTPPRDAVPRSFVKPHRAARSIADLEAVLERVQGISDPAAVDTTPAPSAMPIPATGDLRVEAAAAYLSQRLGWQISPAMVRNWRFRGYFPASYKAGETRASPIFFRRDELDAFEPPVRDHWGPGKPKYHSAEERAAAEEAVRQRALAKRRAQPPDGYIGQDEALDLLGFSRQRLHSLAVLEVIRTQPPYAERAAGDQRHWRVWYHRQDVLDYAARRGGTAQE
jgi:hypothetical protein